MAFILGAAVPYNEITQKTNCVKLQAFENHIIVGCQIDLRKIALDAKKLPN